MFWFGMALSAVGMLAQAQAQVKQAEAQREAANFSARLSEQDARAYTENYYEALRQSSMAVEDVRRRYVQTEGDTLAAFAANGMDVNSASAVMYMAQGAESANYDADVVRQQYGQAAKEQSDMARRSLIQAEFSRRSGQASYQSGMLSAGSTILSGLGQMGMNYYQKA